MPHDDLDRDKMYTSRASGPDEDDDADLELEPLDPELVAAEERRAAAAIEVHRSAIDVDAVYREFEANRDSEIVREWMDRLRNLRFQFGTRHLLILTAIVAVLVVLSMWMGPGTVIMVGIMLAVAGLTLVCRLTTRTTSNRRHRCQQHFAWCRQQYIFTNPPSTARVLTAE
jgi:hypothetical protein